MSLFDRSARCATVISKDKCGLTVLTRKAFFYIKRYRSKKHHTPPDDDWAGVARLNQK
jgi:hypothetical protein